MACNLKVRCGAPPDPDHIGFPDQHRSGDDWRKHLDRDSSIHVLASVTADLDARPGTNPGHPGRSAVARRLTRPFGYRSARRVRPGWPLASLAGAARRVLRAYRRASAGAVGGRPDHGRCCGRTLQRLVGMRCGEELRVGEGMRVLRISCGASPEHARTRSCESALAGLIRARPGMAGLRA